MLDQFRLDDVPDDVLAEIAGAIIQHSTSLLRVSFDLPGVDLVEMIGSGTFVCINGCYGILTAWHVSRQFTNDCFLGLSISPEGLEGDFKIPVETLSLIRIAEAESVEYGPDLAFIHLDDACRLEIAETKDFYSIDEYRPEILDTPPNLSLGVWVVCGGLEQTTTIEDSLGPYDAVVSFQQYCGFGGIDSSYEKSSFDYLEMETVFTPTRNVPTTFRGMSGGGLWQVPIALSAGSRMTPSRFLLTGVIFWQSGVDEGLRTIRAHGRKSLHEIARSRILEEFA